MADRKYVARLTNESVAHPFSRIGGLEPALGRKRRQRVAGAPERLSGLTGAQLPAVPDAHRLDAQPGRLEGEELGGRASASGEGTHRIFARKDGVGVVHEKNQGIGGTGKGGSG